MTEEKLREITAELKAAIDQERIALGPILTALSGGHQELRRDVDDAARKLLDVTAALVAADGALAQRLDRLESVIENWSILAGGDPPKRQSLLARFTRRT